MQEEGASLFCDGRVERNADVKTACSAKSWVKSVRIIANMSSVMSVALVSAAFCAHVVAIRTHPSFGARR